MGRGELEWSGSGRRKKKPVIAVAHLYRAMIQPGTNVAHMGARQGPPSPPSTNVHICTGCKNTRYKCQICPGTNAWFSSSGSLIKKFPPQHILMLHTTWMRNMLQHFEIPNATSKKISTMYQNVVCNIKKLLKKWTFSMSFFMQHMRVPCPVTSQKCILQLQHHENNIETSNDIG